jgi:hypothetical protein
VQENVSWLDTGRIGRDGEPNVLVGSLRLEMMGWERIVLHWSLGMNSCWTSYGEIRG